MDETNKKQIKEIHPPIPAKPGKHERFDTEYERNGTSNIFISFAPLLGKRKLKVTDHRKGEDWAYFIKELVDDDYKPELWIRQSKVVTYGGL